MCKILVISDVHGRLRDLRWVLQNETADAMFYLGDGLYDLNAALELRREPVPYPIYRVAGNCDVNYSEPSEGLAPFGGVLFFYTHGHHYGVKMGSERLAECAGERGADVALFGHTHRRELVRGVADGAAGPTALVTGMLGYIERSFAACSLEEMAAHFHVSPNYASALLKQQVGKTYRQLVQERRLARAAELLRAGATAEAAARAVGYENMSFFYRKFRAAYGCTPAKYRG